MEKFCLLPLDYKCISLQEEVRDLRHKLKDAELTAEQERHLRSKMSDDSSSIVRENATLHQQTVETTKQLERVNIVLEVIYIKTYSQSVNRFVYNQIHLAL